MLAVFARCQHVEDMAAGAARLVVCWSSAFLLWAAEMYIHMRCGFGKEVYEDEGDCAGLPDWKPYLTVCEGICRSGLAVALAGMLWRTCAYFRRQVADGNVHRAPTQGDDGGNGLFAVKAFLATLTLGVGLWSVVPDEELVPEWVALAAHIFDIGCHTVVTTALVGLLIDICDSIVHRRLLKLAGNFVSCRDDIEAHGVRGRDPESDSEGQRHLPTLLARAGFMWLVFCVALASFVADQTVGLPLVATVCVELLGVFCWVGITWSVIGSCAHLKETMASVPGASLSNLAILPTLGAMLSTTFAGETGDRGLPPSLAAEPLSPSQIVFCDNLPGARCCPSGTSPRELGLSPRPSTLSRATSSSSTSS